VLSWFGSSWPWLFPKLKSCEKNVDRYSCSGF
jgi:hypothetical protein